ncbi:cytochrome P450 [Favolaschia claudopus]|uniref:Cytochrome P450 n=1 Tax=Favolaschia claudopus TaxID=2862362 RepID=A0AAV9ZKF4_9AGAR
MHPVYVNLYQARQKVLEEGGSAALAETAAGGKDLITSMTEDQDLQARLRAELREAKAAKKAPGEDLDYSELESLPLLDRKMLRIYSPVTFVWRQTIKDVLVTLTYPIRSTVDGSETNQLLIHEGTAVYLGMSAANRSTAIWGPDAAEFRPERWLNKTQWTPLSIYGKEEGLEYSPDKFHSLIWHYIAPGHP